MHWSWFLVAIFQIQYRMNMIEGYNSLVWCAYEYLALFGIVLLHEFGHSLACRSVGGRADQIVLWPLGGVAYVDPPPRPGANLWSIAAGPLVNLMLLPIFTVAVLMARGLDLPTTNPNLFHLLVSLWFMDVALFCFNMLPIYPLDGGQILRSLLWFWLGRARSLMVASVIGIIALVALLVFAIRDTWLLVMAVFALMNCWRGLQSARALGKLAAAPRHAELACPHCHAAPPKGDFWVCGRCRAAFDMFACRGVCPSCGTIFNATRCQECGEAFPLTAFGNTGA